MKSWLPRGTCFYRDSNGTNTWWFIDYDCRFNYSKAVKTAVKHKIHVDVIIQHREGTFYYIVLVLFTFWKYILQIIRILSVFFPHQPFKCKQNFMSVFRVSFIQYCFTTKHTVSPCFYIWDLYKTVEQTVCTNSVSSILLWPRLFRLGSRLPRWAHPSMHWRRGYWLPVSHRAHIDGQTNSHLYSHLRAIYSFQLS